MKCKTENCGAELRLEGDRLVCPNGHYNEKALICGSCENPMDRSGLNYQARCHHCETPATYINILIDQGKARWATKSQTVMA